jgi:hypothetical protein
MATLPACDNSGHARLSPKGNEARVALEAVLSAWRDGRPYDKLESTPVVRVIDSAWRDGQSLESFEILTEEQSDDGNKVFSVKLSPKKPAQEQQVVYLVHGKGPIWVYREDDYNRMLQMDDNPTKTKSRPRQTRRGK